MTAATGYILGQTPNAALRLEIQDRHFAVPSEQLLDELAIRPNDRVIELGCGPGGFTKRIAARLGADGIVVAVDSSADLQAQAAEHLKGAGPCRIEFLTADVSKPGEWLNKADVVVGRAVLHHIPMAEILLGRFRALLQPGTRMGFLEPDFRSPLARLAYLESSGHPEYAALRVWATAINDLYQARCISPCVGATLERTLQTAGFRHVRATWQEFPTDQIVLQNMLMFYDEVREPLERYGILSGSEITAQQQLLQSLPAGLHPGVWGMYLVSCEV